LTNNLHCYCSRECAGIAPATRRVVYLMSASMIEQPLYLGIMRS
jgi:hypothetical protein